MALSAPCRGRDTLPARCEHRGCKHRVTHLLKHSHRLFELRASTFLHAVPLRSITFHHVPSRSFNTITPLPLHHPASTGPPQCQPLPPHPLPRSRAVTALEVLGSRVEGDMVIVSLQPAMQAPPDIHCGVDDVQIFEVEREAKVQLEGKMRAEGTRHRLRSGVTGLLEKNRQATEAWQANLMKCQREMAMAKAASAQSKLVEMQIESAALKLVAGSHAGTQTRKGGRA